MNSGLATKTPGDTIKEMPVGVFTTLVKVKPMGALQARRQAGGAVAFCWRYSMGAKSERVNIGIYDPSAPPKRLTPTDQGYYSIAAAVSACEKLAIQHHAHKDQGGRPALVAAEREAKTKATSAKADAAKHTLENLLSDYCDHLEALGRTAHKDARSIFKLHVTGAWPKVAALPANQVTVEQIADMMRRVIELGKGRTSNKLRSYVRAAYQTAKAARSKPSIPLKFKAYSVTHNPGADTEPDDSANRADKRPLSVEDLRTYWQAIKNAPGFRGAVLRLHLLTGGQRIEQLVSLRTENVSGDTIMLFDGKGRPGKPARPHTVPLIPHAAAALLGCVPRGTWAISTDGGDTHLSAITLSHWAVAASRLPGASLPGVPLSGVPLSGVQLPGFQAKRIRSGVETLLASARISSDIRGRLQSHGISGVQSRHYDGHDYLAEKRQALETLFRLLDAPEESNVVQFKAA